MPITAKLTQGKHCSISPEAFIGFNEHGGEIILGDNVTINHGAVIRTCTGIIRVGTNVSIGYNAIIHALGGVTIGDNTMVSPMVQIYAQNHGLGRSKSMRVQPQSALGISIGKDCWIGAGAILCDGVTLDDGCVIAAGAVVPRGTYGGYTIYGGNPAKKLGGRR